MEAVPSEPLNKALLLLLDNRPLLLDLLLITATFSDLLLYINGAQSEPSLGSLSLTSDVGGDTQDESDETSADDDTVLPAFPDLLLETPGAEFAEGDDSTGGTELSFLSDLLLYTVDAMSDS
jgi:hypothetical protein